MTLDRTEAPDFKVIKTINLPEPQSHVLDNGIPLHVISIGEQPVVRFECIFESGNWHETSAGASFFAIKMLPEGTRSYTSSALSEAFDNIGAFIDMTHSSDRSGIVVYCLSRFLPEVLTLIRELIENPVFPEKELDDLRNITLQNLRINKEKTAYLATTEFRRQLFGSDHPYGQSQEEKNIQELPLAKIQEHFEKYIKNGKRTLVLAGQVSDQDVKLVNEYFGQLDYKTNDLEIEHDSYTEYQGKEVLVEKSDSVQSTIRIGRKLFTRKHPDYFKMLVTNEILGGYFGSRLMKNIREEKGLTYGISSHMITLGREGYFMIGTDVKKEFTQQTIDEIKKEIYRLQTEVVGEDELQTVKNFMAGEFAGSLNTAFEVADRQKILFLDSLPADYFSKYIDQIHATTQEDIQLMASTYLLPEEMIEVVVGGK
ncbi:M16 family metallopeptidase [Dyadobacter subterraneus]|uniref:Insulinase family protein n=1 Tax=Dyadobacter subterraneus TaxID=2773304 RepID=A0ABR9WIX6_9BACT|nr:pitrilysin family protein [Dyadobacter subterraneus]MBE9465457.1 insulinase family protein [Dyadobacter subterraneus]